MKCRFIIVLVLFVSMVPTGSVWAKTARLFLLSGQSNAKGYGNGDLLPKEYKLVHPDVLMYTGDQQGWIPLAPVARPHQGLEIDNTSFGVEMSFAHALKKKFPNDVIAVVKIAMRGGASILVWDKDWRRSDWKSDLIALKNEDKIHTPLYDPLIMGYKRAKMALKQRSDVDQVIDSGVLWLQNERDSIWFSSAKAYGERLKKFIQDVRTDLSQSNLPVMVMDAHVSNSHKNIIHDQLYSVKKVINNMDIIRCDDLPTHEGIHFNTIGVIELGKRFANSNVISK